MTNSPSAPSPKGWQDLLDQLNTSGNFFRPKEGSTKLRLVPLKGMDYEAKGFRFWAEATTVFRGQERTKFVVPALILEAKGATESMMTTVTAVILSKKALKGIIGLLAEGYELFGPEGYGIVLKRTGQGLDTDYNVLPSKNPVLIDEDEITVPDLTIDEMAMEFQKWATRPGAGQGKTDEEYSDDFLGEDAPPQRRSAPAGGNRGGQTGGRRRSERDDF